MRILVRLTWSSAGQPVTVRILVRLTGLPAGQPVTVRILVRLTGLPAGQPVTVRILVRLTWSPARQPVTVRILVSGGGALDQFRWQAAARPDRQFQGLRRRQIVAGPRCPARRARTSRRPCARPAAMTRAGDHENRYVCAGRRERAGGTDSGPIDQQGQH
ncbi:hypothetical protein KZ829_33510 [Actinoplanes hulinensis]|uniref:Uncharacterized protein n=1 Tax=Actinoplanes hulinensis TaxID=1144547 RepID=A0ABS7BCA9_9ACTN|nr:hypothetical protein [Actinoplanes hulinensis]MBW6438656.1 hypothetical protein [Actinoplanes hulinensis]